MEKARLLKRVNSYFISNTLTKVFSFCLVILYAFYISPDNFGDYEYVQSLINIVVPFSFLSIWEAILKFGLDEKVNKPKVIGTSVMFTLGMAAILTIVCITYFCFNNSGILIPTFVTLTFVLDGIRIMWQHYLKILNKYDVYVKSSVIGNVVSIVSVLVMVVCFRLQLVALFVSSLLGTIISICIIEFKEHILAYIKKNNIDLVMLKNMVKYSMPLVIAAILTWGITGLSKFFIQNYISDEANGIYSFAHKFTIIITFVSTILGAAIAEEMLTLSKDKFNKEFSVVTNKLANGYITLGIIAMPLIMIVYKIIEKTKYYESKKYVPLLILYFIFLTLANHISTVFKKYSKNKYSLLATLIGVVVTIMVMFLSIRRVGVLGVVLAQFLGALTMLITSLIFARKYVKVRINNVKTVLLLLAYILFSTATLMVNWYLLIALFLFTIFVFKDNILDIFKEYKGRKSEESI